MADHPNREEALALLNQYTQSDSLRRHGLGVEQAMRKMAEKYGGDVDEWGVTGLLHDFDYEMYPTMEEHPYKGNKILKEQGYPESVCRAIMGHATYSGVPRDTDMAKALFAVDELTGFIFAVTYVRPSRSIQEVTPRSVKKKLKQKIIHKKLPIPKITLMMNLTQHLLLWIVKLNPKYFKPSIL